MELCIDTATRYAGIALAEDGHVIAQSVWHSRNNHTAELAPAVMKLLREADTEPRRLSGIIAVVGPGGFSALRVGLGLAKGLAESLDVPIAPVSALEVEAARHFEAEEGPLLPLLEVGRDRVAWCTFERAGNGWRLAAEEQVTALAVMVQNAPSNPVYCGEGAWHTAERLQEVAPHARVLASEPPTRSLTVLAALGHSVLASGSAPDRRALEPNYLRSPSITLPAGQTPSA